jgi:hypothetical protein
MGSEEVDTRGRITFLVKRYVLASLTLSRPTTKTIGKKYQNLWALQNPLLLPASRKSSLGPLPS